MAAPTTPTPRNPRRSTAKSTATTTSSTAANRAKTTRRRAATVVTPVIDAERRRAMIAEAAYLRAERRNFAPGFEVEDWLSAESEVDTLLTLGVAPSAN